MAAEFQVEHTRRTVYLIAPENITVNAELNGRHDLPDIEWLIADIVQRGQLQPILVRNDGGTPTLAAGHSRWRAAIELKKRGLIPDFKLHCVLFRGTAQEAFLANISENRVRNANTPLDDAHNIARLERYGMTIGEIAEHYRESEAWCKGRLGLISLCEEAAAALGAGEMKLSAAAHIAKLTEEQQRKALKSGKKLTAGTIRKFSGKPEKKSRLNIKAVLQAVIDEGEYPAGYEAVKSADPVGDSIAAFCAVLLKMIG